MSRRPVLARGVARCSHLLVFWWRQCSAARVVPLERPMAALVPDPDPPPDLAPVATPAKINRPAAMSSWPCWLSGWASQLPARVPATSARDGGACTTPRPVAGAALTSARLRPVQKAADLNVVFDQYGQRNDADRREVRPPVPVEAATWQAAGELDYPGQGKPASGGAGARAGRAPDVGSGWRPPKGVTHQLRLTGARPACRCPPTQGPEESTGSPGDSLVVTRRRRRVGWTFSAPAASGSRGLPGAATRASGTRSPVAARSGSDQGMPERPRPPRSSRPRG